MFVTRWEPWSEMYRLSRELDRAFSRGGTGISSSPVTGVFPSLNLWEDGNNVYAEAELPGLSMDDLEIYMTGNELTVKGERHAPQNEAGTWHRQERSFGKFSRVVELPYEVETDEVTAEYKLGVLTITLPKREASKPRRISVNAK